MLFQINFDCSTRPLLENSFSEAYILPSPIFNLFTTIHDGNFRRHSSMNVTKKMTQILVKYILHLCIFRHLKLEIALAIPASNDEK